MKITKHTFKNETNKPFYIYIEPWPHAFELEINDTIMISFEADAEPCLEAILHGENEMTLYPNFHPDRWLKNNEKIVDVFINDQPAENRSWKFKRKKIDE